MFNNILVQGFLLFQKSLFQIENDREQQQQLHSLILKKKYLLVQNNDQKKKAFSSRCIQKPPGSLQEPNVSFRKSGAEKITPFRVVLLQTRASCFQQKQRHKFRQMNSLHP